MYTRSKRGVTSSPTHADWLRRRGSGVAVGVVVMAMVLTTWAGIHSTPPARVQTSTSSSAQTLSIQYLSVLNLADPGFSATATSICPDGTILQSGTHTTSAGATLVSEGASGNAWVVTARGSGDAPAFFSAVAACLSLPKTPSLQIAQGTFTGTASGTVNIVSVGYIATMSSQPVSFGVNFDGAAGFPWSIPSTGQITVTWQVTGTPVPTTFTLSGSAVGQYIPSDGSLVENITLHASSTIGDFDLPLSLTTGTVTVGSITLTGSPVDANGNVTVVAVGTPVNGTGLAGFIFSGSTVQATIVGKVSGFPSK